MKMESQAVFQAKLKPKMFLLNCHPDCREVAIAHDAVEEWKAEIAVKKRADKAAKEALLSMMRRALRESAFFSDMGASFDPDDISDLSCVMQPLCISPMINFPGTNCIK